MEGGEKVTGKADTALITQDKDLNQNTEKGSESPLGAINRCFCTFTHMDYGDKLNGMSDIKHHWLSGNTATLTR